MIPVNGSQLRIFGFYYFFFKATKLISNVRAVIMHRFIDVEPPTWNTSQQSVGVDPDAIACLQRLPTAPFASSSSRSFHSFIPPFKISMLKQMRLFKSIFLIFFFLFFVTNFESDGHRLKELALNEKCRPFFFVVFWVGGGGRRGSPVTLRPLNGAHAHEKCKFRRYVFLLLLLLGWTGTTDITASAIDTQRFICRQVG